MREFVYHALDKRTGNVNELSYKCSCFESFDEEYLMLAENGNKLGVVFFMTTKDETRNSVEIIFEKMGWK